SHLLEMLLQFAPFLHDLRQMERHASVKSTIAISMQASIYLCQFRFMVLLQRFLRILECLVLFLGVEMTQVVLHWRFGRGGGGGGGSARRRGAGRRAGIELYIVTIVVVIVVVIVIVI